MKYLRSVTMVSSEKIIVGVFIRENGSRNWQNNRTSLYYFSELCSNGAGKGRKKEITEKKKKNIFPFFQMSSLKITISSIDILSST